MKIKDLKAAIASLPDDMLVLGEWDGFFWAVHSAGVRTRDPHDRPILVRDEHVQEAEHLTIERAFVLDVSDFP